MILNEHRFNGFCVVVVVVAVVVVVVVDVVVVPIKMQVDYVIFMPLILKQLTL